MINKTCSLITHDVFSYDIISAYPTIMNGIGWEFNDVDLSNKEERNISIGKNQINNPNLSSFLMTSVGNLVDYYLQDNKIEESQIIISQRDGFILTKKLTNIEKFITMTFRGMLDNLIISLDRKKYLASSDGEVTVKGMPHMYYKLEEIYQMFGKLNFFSKKNLFVQLNNIKKTVLNSIDKSLFMIPYEKTYAIVTKKYGTVQIQNEKLINIDDIDKMHYYRYYFKPFLDSIYLECY